MNVVDGTAYSLIHGALLRRVERGGLDADGDRALIEEAIRTEVTDYQRRAHLDDHLTALGNPEQLVVDDRRPTAGTAASARRAWSTAPSRPSSGSPRAPI